MKANAVNVEIITIGDEILIGQIVDTNSAWLATELNAAGLNVAQITSVHDKREHITEALDAALKRADVVLLTGGLGPTNDDITKHTLSDYFGSELVFDDSVLKNIELLFSNRPGFVVNDLTMTQAMVPDNCVVIQNKVGTAPVLWFDHDDKVVVALPGVPYEMKTAMTTEVLGRLKEKLLVASILHKTVLVYGYGESALAMKIADWESSLPENITLAYLPVYGVVKLRLSGISDDLLALDFQMSQQMGRLSVLLGDAIVANEDVSVEKMIASLLLDKGLTLSTAESCTGGYIAHLFTSIPGSSAFFNGTVVAYSNDVKANVLRVDVADIAEYGAVSASVVEQMANGVRRLMKTDVAVATSGIAGPDGGSVEKPVGTVWIAVSSADATISREYRFGTLREQNIHRAAQAAMLMLREIL